MQRDSEPVYGVDSWGLAHKKWPRLQSTSMQKVNTSYWTGAENMGLSMDMMLARSFP